MIKDIVIEMIWLLDIKDIVSLLSLNKSYYNINTYELWQQLVKRDLSILTDIISQKGVLVNPKTTYINLYTFQQSVFSQCTMLNNCMKNCYWSKAGLKLMYYLYTHDVIHFKMYVNMIYTDIHAFYNDYEIIKLLITVCPTVLTPYMDKKLYKRYCKYIINIFNITTEKEVVYYKDLITLPTKIYYCDKKIVYKYGKNYFLITDIVNEILQNYTFHNDYYLLKILDIFTKEYDM